MGWWGHMGSRPQKGITTYAISPYAARPFKGAFHAAFFNVFRRVRNQALYIALPVGIFWAVWTDARDYNEYLYTKAGREELERVNV